MAILAYTHSGTAPRLVRMKIASSFAAATIGGFALDSADGGAGINHATQDSAANCVGATYDSGVYSTTQGDAEGVVSVAINPDAVWGLKMVGTNANGQLSITTNSAADTGGTVVTITTGDPVPNSPTMDEGYLVCVSGANVGQTRKITTVSATAITVLVPFTNDIASGDVFIAVPWAPFDVAGNNVRLDDSSRGNAVQAVAVGTGAEFRHIEVKFDTSGQTFARQNSWLYTQADDHWLNLLT